MKLWLSNSECRWHDIETSKIFIISYANRSEKREYRYTYSCFFPTWLLHTYVLYLYQIKTQTLIATQVVILGIFYFKDTLKQGCRKDSRNTEVIKRRRLKSIKHTCFLVFILLIQLTLIMYVKFKSGANMLIGWSNSFIKSLRPHHSIVGLELNFRRTSFRRFGLFLLRGW